MAGFECPPRQTGPTDLLNFIAIEPVVTGAGSRYSRMGFSALEPSQLDLGKNGKRLWLVRGCAWWTVVDFGV